MKQILLLRRTLFVWSQPPVLTALKQPRYALVDDEDFDWLNEHKWFLMGGDDYVRGYIDGFYVHMHRMVMQRYQPREDPDSWDVRHKDKETLHNNRANLEWIPCQRSA